MRGVLAVVFVLLATVASAQTHPCDALPAPSVVHGPTGLVLWFCVKPSDALIRVDVILDGVQTGEYVEGDTEAQGGPNGEGYVLFKAPFPIAVTPGPHTIRLTAINDDGSGQEQTSDVSEPFSFTAKRPKPSKPKVAGVTQ